MTEPEATERGEIERSFFVGAAAWPTVTLSMEDFAAAVAELDISRADLATHGSDLYLAIGCRLGRPDALAAFEESHIARVGEFVARLRLRAELVDEVRQLVRIRMLTGEDAKIRQYSGRGSLDAWVRVVAIRTALNRLEARRPDEVRRDEDGLEALMNRGVGGESGFIAESYREPFQKALEVSLSSLTPRDKTVLRMSFLDGKSIDVIGDVFGVHRATVARWLVAIRKRVLDEVRRGLSMDLQASSTEVQSLIRQLGPDVRVSVARLLGTPNSTG